MFVAFYGIIRHDAKGDPRVELKHDTIFLCGLPTQTREEAESLAKDCARITNGPTCYHPRVFEQQEGESFLDVCDRAGNWYVRLVKDMVEAEAIHARARQL